MKKLISMALLMAMVLSLLVGCARESEQTSESVPTESVPWS